jgi:CRP-like cAMP-binding protein
MSIEPEDLPLLIGSNQASKDIVLEAPVRHFVDRDILLHDQGAAKAVYALLEGQVRIERRGTKVAQRLAGELVGEQAFIDRKPHSADIIADGDVRAVELIGERMEQLLLDPVLARTLMSIVSCKLREATNDRYVRYAQREKLFAAFGQFVDPRYRDDMLEKGDAFGTPTVRTVIVLFTDARDFTATAATMDPMQLGQELGAYVGTIGDILRAHGAFVDKYIGDGVMAFWGYPGMPAPNGGVTLAAAKQILAATASASTQGTRSWAISAATSGDNSPSSVMWSISPQGSKA